MTKPDLSADFVRWLDDQIKAAEAAAYKRVRYHQYQRANIHVGMAHAFRLVRQRHSDGDPHV